MSDLGWGLVLLGGYVLLVMLARGIYIARTNVVWSSAQAGALAKRLSHQVGGDSPGNDQAEMTKSTIRRLLREIEKGNPTSRHAGVIGWNGSHQIAQWVLMHEAERLALPALDRAQLVARLERALGQLSELPQARREAWEDAIRSLLAVKDTADTDQLNRVSFSGRSTSRPTAMPSSWRGSTTGLPGSFWSPCSRWGCWPASATASCWWRARSAG
jgi:hypothetical protein